MDYFTTYDTTGMNLGFTMMPNTWSIVLKIWDNENQCFNVYCSPEVCGKDHHPVTFEPLDTE